MGDTSGERQKLGGITTVRRFARSPMQPNRAITVFARPLWPHNFVWSECAASMHADDGSSIASFLIP